MRFAGPFPSPFQGGGAKQVTKVRRSKLRKCKLCPDGKHYKHLKAHLKYKHGK